MSEKNYFISDLRQKMYDTCLSAGIPIISDDECCQLLAYLHLEGGCNEEITLRESIRSALFYAQKRLNIYGGERPNTAIRDLMSAKNDQIKDELEYMRNKQKNDQTASKLGF